MYRVKFEAGRRFVDLLRVVYRVSQEHVKRASTCVQRLVYVKGGGFKLLGDLCFNEAVLLCAFLEKSGFKAGRESTASTAYMGLH